MKKLILTDLDKRVISELGDRPMRTYDLAHKVWPSDKFPKMWNYRWEGGPPVWNLTLGKIAKRLGLQIFRGHGRSSTMIRMRKGRSI